MMTTSEEKAKEQRELALTIPVQNKDRVFTEEKLPYPTVTPVFLCMKQTTRPRIWFLQITLSPWLDIFSSLMVLLNCVVLGLYKPLEEKDPRLELLEFIIFGYFMIEMLVKMLALGIFGYEGSYLSYSWNKFDFLINFGEVLDHCLNYLEVNLYVFQILRPVRLVGKVHSLRVLVAILLDTVPMFANVLILYIFVIHIFGVVGVQLWKGALHNRCFLGEDIPAKYNVSLSPYYMSEPEEKLPFICSPDGKHGMRRCHHVPPSNVSGCSVAASAENGLVPTLAGAGAGSCVNWNSFYNVCRPGGPNPYRGAINFDNIGFAWITIFQVVTLEGWTEIMFYVIDAHSLYSFIFFILITIMGSFIMMNVCAVVIATHFSENMEKEIVEQSESHVSMAWAHEKFTFCLQKILCRQQSNANRNKVHPKSSGSQTGSALVQAWKPLERKLRRIVESQLFDQAIMFAVFISILAMIMEHHEQPMELTYVLHIINLILTAVFVFEMVIKLLALSVTYFFDLNNVFDFSIVIVSVWELSSKAGGKLSVLRAFRVLRFVKLVHFLPYLKRQLMVLKRTMKEAAALCKLLLFVIFLFSVMGMILFGGKFSYKTKHGEIITDRKNFDTLLWSMVTVFQILTQEDWNLVLYNAMNATSAWAALYFVVLIVIGKHVLLNVLVGIVVQSFQARPSEDFEVEASSSSSSSSLELSSSYTSSWGSSSCTSSSLSRSIAVKPTSEEVPSSEDSNQNNKSFIRKVLRWCKEHEEWSLYLLSPRNKFRICCQSVIHYKMFDHVVLFFILLSCITISMERPGINPKGFERYFLNLASDAFNAIFFLEMLLKVLALGFMFGTDNYCSSSWNVMDGLLVFLNLIQIIISQVSAGQSNMLGMLKVFRLLRTLRPLRVIKRAPKLKLAVEALIAAVKPIGNIVIISCIFFFLYGILGVQLFKGKFFHCVGRDTRNVTTKGDCLSANYLWIQKPYNFDNLPQALMSLFVMYSKDGWVSLMYDGLDAVGVDKQPVKNHNQWVLIFFISFMVVSFFLLDMFIGVMVETFAECQQQQRRGNKVPEEEAGAQAAEGKSCEPERRPYYTYYSPFRRYIHRVCTSHALDLFMSVVIVLSVLMMAFEHHNQPRYIGTLTEIFYYLFTAILIIEVLLKFFAFGVLRFLKISWNVLDVSVVLISIISIIFTKMKMQDVIPINPSILRVCRVLRLAQVLKAKKIRVLLETLIKTLSQVGNICLLFAFFFFIYAALGVELFGKLECTDDYPCHGLHRYVNFKHFWIALLTLYQVCTGDNWSSIMKDTLRKCRPNDANCVSYLSWVSPIYFSSFVILAQFVLVNLVVAAIMQALEDCNESIPVQLPPETEEGYGAEPTPEAPGDRAS